MSITEHRVFILLFLQLLLIMSGKTSSPGHRPHGLCGEVCIYKDNVQANCKNKNLERVPSAGGCSSATTVDMSHNQIEDISPTDFAGYTKVKVLLLGNNEISTISENMCGNATQILQLHLNDNKLVTIPRNAFSNLEKLTGLFLDINDIQSLEPGAFNGLFRMGELYLLHNNITSIPDGVFRSLRSLVKLNLSYNKILELTSDTFTGLKQLLRMDLSYNQIITINADTFNDLGKLFWVSLAGNNLVSFTSSLFSALPLKHLDMSNNNISSFENLNMFLNQKKDLTKFILSGISLECNCTMEPLRVWYRLHDPTSDAICKSPVEFNGLHLSDFDDPLCIRTYQQQHDSRTTVSHYNMAMDDNMKAMSSKWIIVGGVLVVISSVIIIIVVIFVCRRSRKHRESTSTRQLENQVSAPPADSMLSGDIPREKPDLPPRSTSMIQENHNRHTLDKPIDLQGDEDNVCENSPLQSPDQDDYIPPDIPSLVFDGNHNVTSLNSSSTATNDINYIKHTYLLNPGTHICQPTGNAPNAADVYVPFHSPTITC